MGRARVLSVATAFFALCVFVATSWADAPPTVTVGQLGPTTATTAHVSGTVNPQGGPSTTNWHFEYTHELNGFLTVWTPSASGELSGTEAEGTDPVPVEGTIEGLEPGSRYYVRLFAENEFGVNQAFTQAPYPSFTTQAATPEIQSVSVEPLATEALLRAEVNPGGNAGYHVEYGATAAYGRSTASFPLKAGLGVQSIKVGMFGLSPGATYHARLVVENAADTAGSADQEFTTTAQGEAVESCPNKNLRTGPSASLPECRAYEMVSPTEKFGNDAGAPGGQARYALSSADGNTLMYGVRGAMGKAVRGLEDYAIGRRTADGWTSETAQPAGENERIYSIQYDPFNLLPSSDFSRMAFMALGSYTADNPNVSAAAGAYLGTVGGGVEWMSKPQISDPYPAPGHIPQIIKVVGGTPDLSTVYVWSGATLLPSDAAREPLVKAAPNFLASPWEVFEYSGGRLKAAGTLPDGSQSPGGAAPANAYGAGREFNQAQENPETTMNQISRDGRVMYFVSPDPGESGEFPISAEPPQLYVRVNGHSTLVSHGPDGSASALGAWAVGARGLGQPGLPHQYVYGAADGSGAIFWSRSALTASAPDDGVIKAYRYDLASNSVTFLPGVGNGPVVAASDDLSRFIYWQGSMELWDHGAIRPIGTESNGGTPARATADGSVFVFQGTAPGFNSGGFEQAYRYDVASAQLSCVTCPGPGVTPTGPGLTSKSGFGVLQQHFMTSDGDRVFFDTPDPLVSRDTNGQRDVYEWTPQGVSLLSTGTSKEGSIFLESSPDGKNVFFATSQGISPSDTDGGYDVYDARVDGGFATTGESACQGDACQGPLATPPSTSGAATSNVNGAGNVPKAGHATISGVRKLSSADLAKLAKGGRARLHLKVSGTGTVKLIGTAKVGKKSLRAISSSFKAKKAGKASIPFALSGNARKALDRRGRLTVSLTIRFKDAQPKVVKFTLRAATDKKGGGR
jgi:hypothetical protein